MSNVIVAVKYQAQRGSSDRALTEIRELVSTVLSREPECQAIEILQDISDPCALILIERWPSKEHFLGPHMQRDHLQAFIQKAGAFLTGPPEIVFWRSIHTA